MQTFESGFLIIDKPEGMTSYDVVRAVRRHFSATKVGHLGTLDPFATGVLPLAIGKATRLVRFLCERDKVYHGTIRLGASTDTYDREGKVTLSGVVSDLSSEDLLEVSQQMVGEQMQVPPAFSAKKIGGIRSYQLARRGIEVRLPPQPVHVSRFDLFLRQSDNVDFEIHCSPGTYVRWIAHELGRRLGCGAHLYTLRRIAVGEFHIDRAIALDAFGQLRWSEQRDLLIPLNQVLLDLPELKADLEIRDSVAHGRDFLYTIERKSSGPKSLFRVVSAGELLGLAEPLSEKPGAEGTSLATYFHPKVVF